MKILFFFLILKFIVTIHNYDNLLNNSFIDQKGKNILNLQIRNLEEVIRKIKMCIIYEAEEVNDYDSLIVINAATNSTYLNELKEKCVGSNYSIINRYYNELTYKMKFQWNYSLKNLFDSHSICEEFNKECLIFFESIDLFMDKDFDLLTSIQHNRTFMELNVGEYLYEIFQKLIIENLKAFKTLHIRWLTEKKTIIDMLENKFTDFIQTLQTRNSEKLNGIKYEKINIRDFFGMTVTNNEFFPVTSIRQAPPDIMYERRLLKKSKNDVEVVKNIVNKKIDSPIHTLMSQMKSLTKKDINRLLKINNIPVEKSGNGELNKVTVIKDESRLLKKKSKN